ncbi:hypothetical protein Poli38472_002819 [Pythium oligandrum]|uniref:PH domain-containing protein n=1 Tax=Pythium oligandrum TaxID=41045 RepID=A0A8K1FDG8_PYTOL|nr:hypothetical protein Poli38472_002819 [Pythium oligandrum]|eukprot:TMW56894.1 hypothetical protein Poli38472_002819 [Pythium oligandrum]
MEGFLDHLESAHRFSGLTQKKNWTRRFFRLNAAFHLLELFSDATQGDRKGKIELADAIVVSADDLGELLFASSTSSPDKPNLSSRLSVQNSRRFIFRVTEGAKGGNSGGEHHYLCAEIEGDPVASRQYMAQWLQALQTVTAHGSASPTSSSVTPMDQRELSAKIATHMDRLHVAMHVTKRTPDPHGKGKYELSIMAWTLQRELSEDELTGSKDWQVLEYSCEWAVQKTSADFKAFDAQLRQLFREELRDLTLPTISHVKTLLHVHNATQREAEDQRRVERYNAYVQQLMCLPAFSAFGSDASAMLDHFLSLSSHLVSFRRLEKSTGQNLQLRKKRVVPWLERERFVHLYQLHLEIARAQQSRKPRQSHHAVRLSSQSERSQRHEHRQKKTSKRESRSIAEVTGPEELSEPVLVESVEPTMVETDSVHDRIARIGRKLIVEAFQATPTAS